MTDMNRFPRMSQALEELRPETAAAQARPESVLPSLSEVLHELGPLPPEALFLGLAADGLPVLLDLHDPLPGPLLLIGDPGAGKTAFLRLVACAAARMHAPADLRFGVITDYPDEWEDLRGLPHCAGVFPTYQGGATDFLLSLAGWAHAHKRAQQAHLLLIDDLESLTGMDADARQNLRWLLLRGPARRVWPIATLNAERVGQVRPWLEAFRTRLFGRARKGQGLADPQAGLESLLAGVQFSLQQGSRWLRFWTPRLD